MNGGTYIASFCIEHPTASAREISEALGVRASLSYSVGDERTTPKGTHLGGHREHSYVVIEFDRTDEPISAFLTTAEAIDLFAGLKNLAATGGAFQLKISKVVDGGVGLEISPAQMNLLATLKVSIEMM